MKFFELDDLTCDKYGYIVRARTTTFSKTTLYGGTSYMGENNGVFCHVQQCRVKFMHELKRDVIKYCKSRYWSDALMVVGNNRKHHWITINEMPEFREYHGKHVLIEQSGWNNIDDAINYIKKEVLAVHPFAIKNVYAYADVAVCFP